MAKHTDGGSLFDFLDLPPDPAPKAEPPKVDPPVESLPPSVLVSTPTLPPTDNIPVETPPSQPVPESPAVTSAPSPCDPIQATEPLTSPITPPTDPESISLPEPIENTPALEHTLSLTSDVIDSSITLPPIPEIIDSPVIPPATPEAVDLQVDGSSSPGPIDAPPSAIADELPVIDTPQLIASLVLPTAPEPETIPSASPLEPLPATLVTLTPPPPAPNGNWWTIPLICLGICMIAVPMLISQADQNRRLNYEHFKLERDLKHIETQISVNEEFLKRIAADPTLAERLAQRQMKMVREGTSILELKGQSQKPEDMSPFLLVTVPPPPPLLPYHPVGGFLASLFRHPRAELFSMGIGFFLIAAGLILGPTPKNPDGTPEDLSDL